MENFGNIIKLTDVLTCLSLSTNKIVTFVKTKPITENVWPVVKYMISKTEMEKVIIYGESFEFTLIGRDNANKIIEMSWISIDMLKNFMSLLKTDEWTIYVK